MLVLKCFFKTMGFKSLQKAGMAVVMIFHGAETKLVWWKIQLVALELATE